MNKELLPVCHEQKSRMESDVLPSAKHKIHKGPRSGIVRTIAVVVLGFVLVAAPVGYRDADLNPMVSEAEAASLTQEGFDLNEWLVLQDFKLPKKYAMFHYASTSGAECLGLVQKVNGDIIPTIYGYRGNQTISYVKDHGYIVPTIKGNRGDQPIIFVNLKNYTIPTIKENRGNQPIIYFKNKNYTIPTIKRGARKPPYNISKKPKLYHPNNKRK